MSQKTVDWGRTDYKQAWNQQLELVASRQSDLSPDTLILTELEQEVAGDAFFPAFSCPPFALVRTEEVEEPIRYSIRTYQRRKRVGAA